MKSYKFYIMFLSVLLTVGFASRAESVVDVIVNSPNHTILETALIEANLVDDLEGSGSFTVFAPTDAAFNALPEGTLEALLADSRGALTQILLYHLVKGKVMSTDLSDGMIVETYNDSEKKLKVTINGAGVFINNAKVTVADVVADNGVVHVIDVVLIPSADVKITETESMGKIITDAYGRTLYLFSRDSKGASLCTGGCLNNWPIFNAEGIEAGAGLNATDFGTIDRGDGVMQTTYKGWPLYYYVQDTVPGQMLGEGVIGKWFVAKPDYTIMITDNQLTGLNGVNYKGDYTPGDEVIQYFTDDKGFTLYTRKNDLRNSNKFTKPDFSNNGVWPIYEETEVVIPSVLNKSDFGIINVYGKNQLTYKGWPLYYFGQDMMVRGNNKGVSVPSPGVWPVPVKDMMLAPLPATVVDIIVNSPDHTTLEAAVVAAGLVETLQSEGPFTVFAPTDEAFAALPAGTVEALLADIPALTNILTYHVVGAKAMSSDLINGQKIVTVQGQEVTVTISDDGVFINNAKVTVADLEAVNGVVHVIDAVLTPLPATVVDIIVNSPDHTTLEAAVVAAGLVETLQGEGPFTVFAPTDAAFAALPEGTVEALLADIPALTNILTYHVVGGKAMSSDLINGQKIVTVQGQEVTVTISDDGVFINNAKVTVADLEAVNGVVHVIDAVLLPPVDATFPIDFEVKTNAVWNVFANGAGAADDFMVIANPDKTGNNTSDNVLKFKVNDGADPWAGASSDSYAPVVFTEDSHKVTMMVWKSVISPVGFKLEGSTNGGPVTEVKVSNTVVNQWEKLTFDLSSLVGYSYNRIVIFPDFPATRTSGTTVYIDNIAIEKTLPATVVDIIVNSPDHTTLEAAVVAAGLVETLQGEGPFTVFAPTDAAFAALPAGTLEALLADIPALTNILTYHVVGAKAMSTDLSDG
ncbi:MAG TPA: fasciclin domain-containing protein, partial [Draconibacterium sp.]|nr:fasciclin domain-containing protein [Draconibacterium sp.]